ncbi:CAPA peptides [Nymphalis io]|uniref:CAPA peptides n=1 Tax=Inachis io TaxID=171585 RepID=UPI0021697C22|nr:CAPA peptides [Nymphalis io]XP_050355745.1 CAPA peptides [Nymphalis io]
MQSLARLCLSVLLLASVVASSYHSSAKLRRDGVLNLYPFPRVGRASHRTWQVPIKDLLDADQIKRQLYAFPRVGRNDPLRSDVQLAPLENILFGRRNPFVKRQVLSEPQAEKDSTGMWFGPRLGRAYKREEDDVAQNDTERSEPEEFEAQTYREKRQNSRT